MAGLYQARGQYEAAEPLYLRALKIREEQLGKNHPNTATSLNNLARLYQARGQDEKAISLLERWRRVKYERQETQNQYFAGRIHTLGKLYEQDQQLLKAASAYAEALSVFSRELGSKHPGTRIFKGEIARVKKKIKRQSKQNK